MNLPSRLRLSRSHRAKIKFNGLEEREMLRDLFMRQGRRGPPDPFDRQWTPRQIAAMPRLPPLAFNVIRPA
jgi:hypothetical protein